MNIFISKTKLKFCTGWKLMLYKLKFVVSLGKYIFQKRKYPLFRFTSLHLFKKQRILEIPKFVKHGKHYYAAVLGVPCWPSKPYDHMVANSGLNLKAAGTPLKTQIDSVILGITRSCNYNCKHCYKHFNLAEKGI